MRGNRRIETAVTVPREENGCETIRDAFLRSVFAFRLQQLPEACLPTVLRVVHHALAARSAFRHSNGKRYDGVRILQPCYRDARARPIEPEIPSRAGAVARFALRRLAPPGEPRRSTSSSGAHLAVRCFPLHVGVFRDRAGSRFRYEPVTHLPGCDHDGDEPRWRCVRRRSPPLLHVTPSCDDPTRHHGERRGPRPASSRLLAARRSRARYSSREQYAARSPPRGGPEHPLSSARVRAWLECRARLGGINPLADQDPRSHRPPRRRKR